MNWISTKDRLPDDGTVVDVWEPGEAGHGYRHTNVAWDKPDTTFWNFRDSGDLVPAFGVALKCISHYMIVEPPEEG